MAFFIFGHAPLQVVLGTNHYKQAVAIGACILDAGRQPNRWKTRSDRLSLAGAGADGPACIYMDT